MPASRRFPPPWSAEVTPDCFIVRDANGQQFATPIMSANPVAARLQSYSAKMRRRIAVNIAKLPELLTKP
jgi:hypothetical protein